MVSELGHAGIKFPKALARGNVEEAATLMLIV